MKKPLGYEEELGPFGPQLFDAACGETVGWGFKIISRLGEDRFNALRQHGVLECAGGDWFLVMRELTRENAVEQFGQVADEKFGPRGGWRSVTFGTTKFISRQMRE